MSFTITQIKENITAMGHGGTLNKVRSFEALCERAANTMIMKVKLVETIRKATLALIDSEESDTDYALPTDFLSMIDLYPTTRQLGDKANRINAGRFDLKKSLNTKEVSIEGVDGQKIIRIAWESDYPFEIKYYSKYLFKDASTEEYKSKPTADDDIIVCDNDSIQIYLLELLKQMAHQLEGSDSAFDISWAEGELKTLYAPYESENPNQSKKQQNVYMKMPRFRK